MARRRVFRVGTAAATVFVALLAHSGLAQVGNGGTISDDALGALRYRLVGPFRRRDALTPSPDSRRSDDLLLRHSRWRRLEDHRRRGYMESDFRRPTGLGDRLASRRTLRSQHHLCRLRRPADSRQRLPRRRPCTSRPTPAKRGKTWGSRTPATSVTSSSTREIQIWFTSLPLDISTGRTKREASFEVKMAARLGRRILYIDSKTGAIDVAFDPGNPRILFASTWQIVRTPWNFVSGGPGSGLYRSYDGGDTWLKLEGNGPSRRGVGQDRGRRLPCRFEPCLRAHRSGSRRWRALPIRRWGTVLEEHQRT